MPSIKSENIFCLGHHLEVELRLFGLSFEESKQLRQDITQRLAWYHALHTPNGKGYKSLCSTEHSECMSLSHLITDSLQASGLKEFESYNAASTFGYYNAVSPITNETIILINGKAYFPKCYLQ